MSKIAAQDRSFTPAAIVWMVAIGVVSFIALLILLAYGPDLQIGQNGKAHALSISATGYKGIVTLIDELDEKPTIIKDDAGVRSADFLVVTPDPNTQPSALAALIKNRPRWTSTLIVLPKWRTVPMEEKTGWVRQWGTLGESSLSELLKDVTTVTIHQSTVANPRIVASGDIPAAPLRPSTVQQRISGSDLLSLLLDESGETVLAKINSKSVYILADPDLLNNQGLNNSETARAAFAVIEKLRAGEDISFDLTLNGFGKKSNLLKLAFEPPFLALTLCMIAAALLAGLHGAYRFGSPSHEERPIAFGKRALLDNSAALIRLAKREHRIGDRYAAMIRDQVASAVAAPSMLSGSALNQFLDRLGRRDTNRYADLEARAKSAAGRADILQAAQALYHWRKDRMRDR